MAIGYILTSKLQIDYTPTSSSKKGKGTNRWSFSLKFEGVNEMSMMVAGCLVSVGIPERELNGGLIYPSKV